MLGVLHTWSRQLIFHPHVHYVVGGGGLSKDRLRWVRSQSSEFFLPEKVLAARFRNRLNQALRAGWPTQYRQLPSSVWRANWVVDIVAVGSGETALKYLSAYVYHTALGNQRIVRDDGRRVTFRYRDSTDGQTKLTTVSAEEFLRRFLQHVLPSGFQRVRYYGWLSAAAKARWERIEALLDWKRPEPPAAKPKEPPLCPQCRQPMLWIERLARAPP
jgi:hypothetical protein